MNRKLWLPFVLGGYMKYLIEKRNVIIFIIIVFLVGWIFLIPKRGVFVKSYSFKGKTITYVIYDRVDKKIEKGIRKIYSKYSNGVSKKYNNLMLKQSDGYFEIDDSFLLCFAQKEVNNYLRKNNINKYIVNVDGDITSGRKNNNDYSVSIHNPSDKTILKIVHFSNKSMSNIDKNEDFKSSKGEKKDYDLIVVISDDYLVSNIYGKSLYYYSIDDGKEIAALKKIDVLWVKDGKIYTTNNFSKYEKNV